MDRNTRSKPQRKESLTVDNHSTGNITPSPTMELILEKLSALDSIPKQLAELTVKVSEVQKCVEYCPLCTKKGLFLIENEFHLIVECEYYATLRNTYLKSEYLNYISFIELFTSTDKSILFNLATFL